MDSFSERLNKLEKSIQPVHHQTLTLTTLKDSQSIWLVLSPRPFSPGCTPEERVWGTRLVYIWLQLCNGSDVDKLLAALEQVIGFHHLSDEVEQKIKKG